MLRMPLWERLTKEGLVWKAEIILPIFWHLVISFLFSAFNYFLF